MKHHLVYLLFASLITLTMLAVPVELMAQGVRIFLPLLTEPVDPAEVPITAVADTETLVLLPLEEGAGTVAGDSSGLGNDGTLVNGAAFEADSGDGSAFAVRFDGVDDYIDLGPLDVNGSGLTLASWFKADSFPGPSNDPRIISKASGTAANDHVFMLSTIRSGRSGSIVRLRARVRVGGATTTLIARSGDLPTGVWQHAAVTYDGAMLRLYLNGVEVGRTSLAGAVDVNPALPVTVGSQPPGAGAYYFDGLLDDVRILQRALSVDELVAIVAGTTPPATPPVANNDEYGTDEDAALVVGAANGVLANDQDNNPPADLTAALVSNVSNGVLNLNADGSFDYTPTADFSGTDSFTYRASDNLLDSNPATVTLIVAGTTPPATPPVANNDEYGTDEDAALVVGAANGVLANDQDNNPPADLTAVLVSNVSNGVLNLNADGSFDYTPTADFSGTDSFTYRASDNLLDSNPATVTIIVAGTTPPATPPVANNDEYSTDEDMALVVEAANGVLANDQDNNPPADLTAVLVSNVSNGVLNLNADGSFDYTPTADFTGTDSFTYQAQDGTVSNLATVTLTVNPVNDAPVAVNDSYHTGPDAPLVVGAASGVLDNDTEPEGGALQAMLASDVTNGVLNLNMDGSFVYTPTPGFSGTDSFTYHASDSLLDSNLATVTISVGDNNSAPRIVSGEIAFTKQVIGTGVDETHTVVAAELNGDGFIDAVATDYIDDQVFLYENDGNGAFQMRLLDASLDGAYPAHVDDVDLDGDTDVLAAGYLADTFVWYENDGNGSFTRHNIDTTANGAHSIVTGDMDQDEDVDLLTSSQDAGNIAWYENDGMNNFTRHIIDASALQAKRAEFADIDGDGDMDVVSASFEVDEVAWHENDGTQRFTKHIITASADGAYFVSPADVDGDGDIDVLSASQLDNTIAWYENLGGGSFSRHPINTRARRARTVIAADIDGDGDVDAVSASVNDDTVALYFNDGNGGFTTQAIDLAADGVYGVFAIDMDSDSDLDVLSASRDSYEVALYSQIRTHEILVEVGGTLVINDATLLTVDVDEQPDSLTYSITGAPAFGVLELNGESLPAGGTFTQDDVNNDRLTYVHSGVNTSSDGFSFTVQDGGENGVRPASGTFTIRISGLGYAVTHLPLEEGAGTVAGDSSGLGNDGTLVNGAAFEADSGDGSSFAVRFDGVDDYIDLGPLDVNGSGLTLASWFKADSFPGPSNDPRIISKASGTVAKNHVFMLGTIRFGSAMRLRARVRVGGITTTLIANSGDLPTGVWQHAAVTYDGAMLRLYLDGVEVGRTSLAGAVDVNPALPVTVGSQPPGAGGYYFDGLLDDVRILQRAMSVDELVAIVAGTATSNVTSNVSAAPAHEEALFLPVITR